MTDDLNSPVQGTPREIQELEACRLAEREQARFYRSLAAQAEESGDAELSQRFHEMHADEQHHFSRLTARLLELGVVPSEPSGREHMDASIQGWATIARERERAEVRRYEELLSSALDETTSALIREILGVEIHHAADLGGKWTMA
ncbi:MAG TPA: hypothetical protein VFI91_00015 [Longimicrobiaceae bacterium]|nr:hypothetical protein [Longimicrobiaceae bacterium]